MSAGVRGWEYGMSARKFGARVLYDLLEVEAERKGGLQQVVCCRTDCEAAFKLDSLKRGKKAEDLKLTSRFPLPSWPACRLPGNPVWDRSTYDLLAFIVADEKSMVILILLPFCMNCDFSHFAFRIILLLCSFDIQIIIYFGECLLWPCLLE